MKVQIKTRLLKEALGLLSGSTIYLTYQPDTVSVRLVSPKAGWAVITQVDVPCTVLEDSPELEQKLPSLGFADVINTISQDAQIVDLTWRTAKGGLLVRWGKGKGNKAEMRLDGETGPKHLAFNDKGRLLRVPSDTARALANAAVCAEKTGARANVEGVGLAVSDMSTEIRSMDGMRLYRAIIPLPTGAQNKYTYSAHLPVDASALLGKHRSRIINLDIDTHVFRFKPENDDGVTLLLRVVPFATTHLDPSQMIETWAKVPGAVDFDIEVQHIEKAIRIAGLFANKSKAIKLSWDNKELIIESWRSDTGKAKTEIEPDDLSGDDFCLLSSRLLLQMLSNIPKDNGMKGDDKKPLKIAVRLNRQSACTFSWGNEMYLLLPMSPRAADEAAAAEEEEGEEEEGTDE
jgi:hypothetical protein